ncbi:MAG: YcjF family protein [Lutimaribacter sp.]
MSKGPVLIELEETSAPPSPAAAPPVPDISADPGDPGGVGAQATTDLEAAAAHGQAMLHVAGLAARPPARLARWFFAGVTLLFGTFLSIAAWDFATALLARMPVLGTAVALAMGGLVILALLIVLREVAAFARLAQLDRLRRNATQAVADDSLAQARAVLGQMVALYQRRADMRWHIDRVTARADEQFDATAVLGLAETQLLAPLDRAAQAQIEAAARQVATVTALVPLALADVIGALVINMSMIRRIAEIYGGRAGFLGSWRLIRAVMAHLVATGAVAVGDDLIGSVAGGTVVSKVSRRFGEGVVNAALTARVGIAALDLCRPLPFAAQKRPGVSALLGRALRGLFGRA